MRLKYLTKETIPGPIQIGSIAVRLISAYAYHLLIFFFINLAAVKSLQQTLTCVTIAL